MNKIFTLYFCSYCQIWARCWEPTGTAVRLEVCQPGSQRHGHPLGQQVILTDWVPGTFFRFSSLIFSFFFLLFFSMTWSSTVKVIRVPGTCSLWNILLNFWRDLLKLFEKLGWPRNWSSGIFTNRALSSLKTLKESFIFDNMNSAKYLFVSKIEIALLLRRLTCSGEEPQCCSRLSHI